MIFIKKYLKLFRKPNTYTIFSHNTRKPITCYVYRTRKTTMPPVTTFLTFKSFFVLDDAYEIIEENFKKMLAQLFQQAVDKVPFDDLVAFVQENNLEISGDNLRELLLEALKLPNMSQFSDSIISYIKDYFPPEFISEEFISLYGAKADFNQFPLGHWLGEQISNAVSYMFPEVGLSWIVVAGIGIAFVFFCKAIEGLKEEIPQPDAFVEADSSTSFSSVFKFGCYNYSIFYIVLVFVFVSFQLFKCYLVYWR